MRLLNHFLTIHPNGAWCISNHFTVARVPNGALKCCFPHGLNGVHRALLHGLSTFIPPNDQCGEKQVYAPRTKILKDRTNHWERPVKVIFKGVSTRFGWTITVCSKFMLPKRRFSKDERNVRMILFEPLFNVESPKSNTHTLGKHKLVTRPRKYLEKARPFVCSDFQNLRLGGIKCVSHMGSIKLYAPQTKILEGGTKRSMSLFERIEYSHQRKSASKMPTSPFYSTQAVQ